MAGRIDLIGDLRNVDYDYEHDYPASLKLRRASEHDKREVWRVKYG
jgi:hypothetical protein